MSDLDQKLTDLFSDMRPSDIPRTIEDIKQVFKEAGYKRDAFSSAFMYADDKGEIHPLTDNMLDENYDRTQLGMMTGREFYNRFWDAMEKLGEDYPSFNSGDYDTDRVIYAARRAAGIEEAE